jgi:hypothetical protein
MVSLWGSKKDDDPEPAGTQNVESSERIITNQPPRNSEADERTRLLPPPTREGYLSPDDPAVSFGLQKSRGPSFVLCGSLLLPPVPRILC